MRRYHANISTNSIPSLTVNVQQFQAKQYASRKPASRPTPELNKKSSLKFSNQAKEIQSIYFTNKRLYFLSLLDQYFNFQYFLPNKKFPAINSCPGLHGAFLEYKKNHTAFAPSLSTNVTVSGALLSLPITHGSRGKVLRDVKEEKGRKKFLQKALSIHTEKIYSELVELCQYGSSDNYYAYENLMNHIKHHPQKSVPSPENLQTLLKTSIFANNIILSNLKEQLPNISRHPASVQFRNNSWIKKSMKKK